jgi:hypothetical protein
LVTGRVRVLEDRLDGLEAAMASLKSDIGVIICGLGLNREQQQQQPVSGVPVPSFYSPPVTHVDLHSSYFDAGGATSQPVAYAPLPSSSGTVGNFVGLQRVNVLPQSQTSLPVAYAPIPSSSGIADVVISQPRMRVLHQSSSDSSPSSPKGLGFAFCCPLCTKPQYTPKSHCGHMRNVADGTGYCSLRRDVPIHLQILQCFSTPRNFASWYVRHLRSSKGPEYTEADIASYNDLQSELSGVLAAGHRVVV